MVERTETALKRVPTATKPRTPRARTADRSQKLPARRRSKKIQKTARTRKVTAMRIA